MPDRLAVVDPSQGRDASSHPLRIKLVERWCLAILVLLIGAYIVALSSKAIAAYATGNTLFDLATFEQGFWNATKGTLFFYSLEGEMSRFGRHFSPIFIPMVPLYALHRDPTTLLVLQTLALGLAAVPLYLFARLRLASPAAALALSVLYLANPATHDVNIVNEFHEIAFAIPFLFLGFYAVERRQWRLYAVAMILVLMTKEELALTVAAMGAYVVLSTRNWRIGMATVIGSLVWFVLVTQIIMPALREGYGPVPFPGYDYLGQGISGIVAGIFTMPGELIGVITAEAKQNYVYWLFEPVAFLSLLAPEALLVAFPALLEILASKFPPTYEIFERYVAPVIPPVFVAAIIALSRVRRIVAAFGWPTRVRKAVFILLLLGMGAATIYSQSVFVKYPTSLLSQMEPDAHSATAIRFTQAIPENASVVVEDHRWLARLAHRRGLYFLSANSPEADYLLLDRKRPPVTNAPAADRDLAIRQIAGGQSYSAVRCEDGLMLYGSRDAIQRDGNLFAPYEWQHNLNSNFGGLIRLIGYSLDKPAVRPGDDLVITLYWQAIREPINADYTVFVNLLDKQWQSVAQHDGRPNDSTCSTLNWKGGLIVQDRHQLSVKANATPGDYDLRIGLYNLADMKRLSVLGPTGNAVDDNVAVALPVR